MPCEAKNETGEGETQKTEMLSYPNVVILWEMMSSQSPVVRLNTIANYVKTLSEDEQIMFCRSCLDSSSDFWQKFNNNMFLEISQQTQILLTRHPDEDIRLRGILNSNEHSLAVLKIFAQDVHSYVRAVVASKLDSSSPKELYSLLANDDTVFVRYAIAKNENTPPEVLEYLSHREGNVFNGDVVRSILGNPNTPKELLAKIYSDTPSNSGVYSPFSRQALLDNINVPSEIVQAISDDENEDKAIRDIAFGILIKRG